MWKTTTVSNADWHNIVFTDDGRHGRQRRRREGPDRRAAPGTNGNSRQHLGIGHVGKIASMSSIGRRPVGRRRRTVSDNSSGGFLGRDESVEVRRPRETVEEGASALVKLTRASGSSSSSFRSSISAAERIGAVVDAQVGRTVHSLASCWPHLRQLPQKVARQSRRKCDGDRQRRQTPGRPAMVTNACPDAPPCRH